MPSYEVTSPDGQRFIVDAPEGASMDQVKAYAQRQWAMKPSAKSAAPKLEIEDPGFLQSTLIGAGRTFDRVGKGMQQLYYGATGDKEAAAELKKRADDEDALYAPLKEKRPWATGIGESIPSMVIPAGGGANLTQASLRMALGGALPGALEYGSADERAKRATAGAVAGAALPVAGALLKSGKSLLEPLYERGQEQIASRLMKRVAGDDLANVTQKLRNATELVPGSAPTAAQVAENGGISALERAMSAATPEAYTRRAMEQSSARLNALRSIAKDDAAMNAAVSARKSATDALYGMADNGVAPIDRTFKSLEMRGQFRQAIAEAEETARNAGLADIFFRDKDGKPIALLGQGAHYIKKALDDMTDAGAATYKSKSAATTAGNTNKLFQDWLSTHIPEYGQAKQAFQAGSKPINQMEIGRALMDKAAPALADFGALGRETGATFANALRNGDALAQKATGMGNATLRNVLDPQQVQLVEGVAKDLARKANAQDLGRGVGSDTFQKLAMQNIAQQSGMPKVVGGLLDLPGVSRATSWMYRDVDQKMQGMIADALLDPRKAADLLQKTDPKILANNPQLRRVLEATAIRSVGLLGLSSAEAMAQP